MKITKLFASGLMGLSLVACSTTTTRTIYVNENPQAAYRAAHGSVVKIEQVQVSGDSTGAGAVIGGIVGGVAGHQVGQGRGNDVATVAGVVGGALIGNEIEKGNNAPKTFYRVAVRLDNGSYKTFQQNFIGDLQTGDRIRVDHNHVVRN